MSSLKGVGVPVKLIHEAIGHIITVEIRTGDVYRGDMTSAEDNWNCQLKNVLATARDGHKTHIEHIFIRGSHIRFLTIPDMLKHAPMFKRIDPKYKNNGIGINNTSVAIPGSRTKHIATNR
jgi:small nuclear ribonucleoprotein D3